MTNVVSTLMSGMGMGHYQKFNSDYQYRKRGYACARVAVSMIAHAYVQELSRPHYPYLYLVSCRARPGVGWSRALDQ